MENCGLRVRGRYSVYLTAFWDAKVEPCCTTTFRDQIWVTVAA